jgi:hyperosmotically inducible periplasmic protein
MMSVPARTMIVLAAVALLGGLGGCHRVSGVSAADLPSARRDHSATAAATSAAAIPPAAAASGAGRAAPVAPDSTAAATPRAASRDDTKAMGAPASTTLASAIAMAAPQHGDDASITREVSSAIAADKELRRLRIDVDTENGIVTLSGPAPTASAKAHADEVARTVPGVVSVNNQLTLQTG